MWAKYGHSGQAVKRQSFFHILVFFYIQHCVGFFPPIVVFKLYVETGTKAQIDCFVKKYISEKKDYTLLERGDQTGCLVHFLY